MKYFYFYDCPRTGGTSFKRWSRRVSSITRVCYGDHNGSWHHVPFKPVSEVRSLAPKGVDFLTFTLLRDPAEHTASLYSKIRTHNHAFKDKLSRISFHKWIYGDFAKDYYETPAPWGFSMVRFYDPITNDLSQAISNIESMDFVGFTERLNDDLNLLMDLAGLKLRFNRVKYNQAYRGFVMSSKDRSHIFKIRSDDYKLVNHFRSKRGLPLYA